MKKSIFVFFILLPFVILPNAIAGVVVPRDEVPRIEVSIDSSLDSQFKVKNAIYVIKNAFDLKGTTLNLPEKSILYFEGGSFRNGLLKGQEITIAGILRNIFSQVILQGTYTNSESNLNWWNCIPYDTNRTADNSAEIQCAFKSSIKIVNVTNMYGVSFPVELPGSSRIQGVCAWGFKQAGFVANDDFKGTTVTLQRDGKNYSIDGMFWHCYDMHPMMKDISIVASKKAFYAIEQLAGYSSCDMDNVFIEGALKAGVLQYGAEQPFFRKVKIRDSHIGFFVSTHRLQKMDIYDPTGDKVSMCNIVNFAECDFSGCNYGCVVKGGSNFVFDNCKTGHNAICGLLIMSTRVLLNNYYTEGDGICNFWIDIASGVKKSSKGRANSLSTLTANTTRLDGFSSKYNSAYDDRVYYRAPVVIKKSNVQVNFAFMSVKPRGNADSNVSSIVKPTPSETKAGGVDALFLVQESGLFLNNINCYLTSTNKTGNSYPFATVIDMAPDGFGSALSRVQLEGTCRDNGGWSPKIYVTSNSRVAAGDESFYLDSPRYEALRPYYSLTRSLHDNNAMMETPRYGTKNKYDFRENDFCEIFNGFPLYKKTRKGELYIEKDEIESMFGERNQAKAVAYIKVVNEFSGVINFKFSYVDKSYGGELAGNALEPTKCDFKKGVYRLEIPIDLSPKASQERPWKYLKCVLSGDAFAEDNCLFSDIYLYDLEDGEMLPHTFVNGVFL